MSKLNTYLVNLDRGISKSLRVLKILEWSVSARNQVADTPTILGDVFEPNGLFFKATKLDEKILLMLLQWYAPAEIRVLITLWIEEHWGADHLDILTVGQISKEHALAVCLMHERIGTTRLFRSILTKQNSKFLQLSGFKRRPTGPVTSLNYNEYRDGGSGNTLHKLSPIYLGELKTPWQLEKEIIQRDLEIELFQNLVERFLMEGP